MRFASAISREAQTEAAIDATLETLSQQTSEHPTHLGFVFASHHHLKALADLLPDIQERLAVPTLIGCTGGGVIGDQREIENRPALALLAASLPGATISVGTARRS